MDDYKICDICDAKMFPTTLDKTTFYLGDDLNTGKVFHDVPAYRCSKCDNVVFEDDVAEMIFDALNNSIN